VASSSSGAWGRRLVVVLVAAFVVIQLLPVGRDHTNPEVTGTPQWSSPRVEELARRACFDCHSNETRWPWYASIAPLSWIIRDHVTEGREHLNFSEFDRAQRHARDAAHEVEEGEMPLKAYLPFHPEARFDDSERRELIAGLVATFGGESEEEAEEGDH
jgi:hypothetical protein